MVPMRRSMIKKYFKGGQSCTWQKAITPEAGGRRVVSLRPIWNIEQDLVSKKGIKQNLWGSWILILCWMFLDHKIKQLLSYEYYLQHYLKNNCFLKNQVIFDFEIILNGFFSFIYLLHACDFSEDDLRESVLSSYFVGTGLSTEPSHHFKFPWSDGDVIFVY